MTGGQAKRRHLIPWLAGGAALGLVAIGGAKVALDYRAISHAPKPSAIETSPVVLDRKGRLLRAFTTADQKWRLPVATSDIDPLYWKMLRVYEDRRFESHSGVDPAALLRAAFQWATSGRIVSGGSTLTMQVARLLEEHPTRSLLAKYKQMLGAVRLESELTKDEILRLYALRAPFGGNLEGVRAASLTWFGKEPRRLTVAEAALLVALPQSPEARRPDRHPDTAREARGRVLARAYQAGLITDDDVRGAESEAVPNIRRAMPFLAAHAARDEVAANPGTSVHLTTLDRDLQQTLETLIRERASSLAPKQSAALIVANLKTGEILASVGSPDLLDEERLGHMDMTQAIRSPGSTLKPLIYGLAFEQGIAHPESYIDDRPIDIGGYRPTNFDLAYQGRVTIREALQLSLNTPAIQLLEAVGPARLVARVKRSGAAPVFPSAEAPGLAIGLGGVGMSLRDLTQLFGAFGNLGRGHPLYIRSDHATPREEFRILDEIAAWHVSDILSGLPQYQSAEASQIAYKTGTAYGYRDAWAVGYDGLHVIGVWTGRADGTPVPGMTGAGTAVPILFDAFQRLKKTADPLPASPPDTLKPAAVDLPIPLRAARVSNPPTTSFDSKLEITYPPSGGIIDLFSRGAEDLQPVVVKTAGGRRPYRWFVNGEPVNTSSFQSDFTFMPKERGFNEVSVVDALGVAKSTNFYIR